MILTAGSLPCAGIWGTSKHHQAAGCYPSREWQGHLPHLRVHGWDSALQSHSNRPLLGVILSLSQLSLWWCAGDLHECSCCCWLLTSVYCWYLTETDLHAVIKKGNLLKDIHKCYILYQLLKATKFIHSGNVIHRDQKVQFGHGLCPSLRFCVEHWIKSQMDLGWKGPSKPIIPTPCHWQGRLPVSQVAPSPI